MTSEAPPAAPRKRLSSDQRRRQITKSARAVFIDQGLKGARTKDIAAAAGINEALLYRHFSSKEELFESAIVEPLEEAVARLVVVSGIPPEELDVTGEVMIERTRAFLRDLVDVLEEIAPLLGVMLFGDVGNATEHYGEQVTPLLERITEVVGSNLDSWSHRDFDVPLLVRIVFGSMWFEAVHARLAGRPLEKDRVADEIAQLIIRGLINPPQDT